MIRNLIPCLLLVSALSLSAAAQAQADKQTFNLAAASRFDGQFNTKLMQKNAQGVFEVADELNFNQSFNLKVSGSIATFDLRWNGTSAKGRRFNFQSSSTSRASFDPATGLLRISVNYTGDIDGQPASLAVDLTTEQITCTGRSLSGKAVQISGAVELVACSKFKDAKVLAKKTGEAPGELFARTQIVGKITLTQ